MATNSWRHKSDLTVGENEASPTKVAGRGPVKYRDGSENRTPPPTKPAPTPDELRSTAWGRGSYGANGWGGSSSTRPGEKVQSALKVNAPVDAVLDNVIRGSESGGDDWQTRRLDDQGDKNLGTSPVHPAFAKRGPDSGSPGGTVPKKTGFTEFNPNNGRKPGS